jgi:Phage polarity suppression protein (Psu)
MTRIPLEQAFEACQQNKVAWLTCKAALSQAEMVYREYELTGHVTGADTPEMLRDQVDLKKWEVNQAAGHYIRAHEAVQRISIRRQLSAFMSEHGGAMAAALAPELMHLTGQPERVRERALDRAAASIREALSVYLATGAIINYVEEDKDILTAIGFRPDRASRTDGQAKYSPEQCQIFLRRQAQQIRKKSA